MTPISPSNPPSPSSQVYWLAQSATVRPARRRGPDMAGVAVSVIATVLLLLVAALGNLG